MPYSGESKMAESLKRREFIGRSAAVAAGLAAGVRADEPAKAPAGGKLKKAVLWSMLPDKLSIAERFKLAANVGFEGVEAQTTEDTKVVEEMREAAGKAGIPIHSVMNMGHWQNPLTSDKPEVVQKSVEMLKISLGNAKAWKSETVLLVPGVVNAETRYKDAYARAQKVIREEVIPAARAAGVTVAIENVWNKFLLSPLEFARFVDECQDERLGAYFDIGNNVQYGFPEDWILTLGKRIKRMHLKDFKRGTNKFVDLREGDVDWPAVRKAITEIGYSGFLTVELPGGDEAYLRDVARRVDLIFEGK